MDLMLFSTGFIGFIVFLIVLILNIIKKRDKRNALIGLTVCFLLVFAGFFISVDTDSVPISSGSKLTKGDLKILDKDYDSLEQEERDRLIIMKSDMTTKELETYKEDLKRLYIQEMGEDYGSKEDAEEIFEENFDYEIRKRKGELTKKEKAKEKESEKRAKDFIQNENNKSEIEDAIIDVVGDTNNMGDKSISALKVNENYGTDEEGDRLVIVNINASENLTNNMTRSGILLDSTEIFKSLFGMGDVSEATLNWEFPLVDQYGNKEQGTIVTVSLDNEMAQKINWENFNNDDLPNISKEYWEHPSLSK